MRPYSIGVDMLNLLHWQTHRLTLASGRVPLQGEASGAFQAPRVIRIAMRRNQRGFVSLQCIIVQAESSRVSPSNSRIVLRAAARRCYFRRRPDCPTQPI